MNNTRLIVMIPVFSALTAAGAMIKLPFWPVALSLQSFFVILAGLALGPMGGITSQLVYIFIGLCGLPVFAGGGGPGYIMLPSFGYLLGFVAAAGVAGSLGSRLNRQTKPSRIGVFLIALAASFAVYAIGTPWLALNLKYVVHKPEALEFAIKSGLLIFVPGDLLKCLLLSLIYPRLDLPEINR